MNNPGHYSLGTFQITTSADYVTASGSELSDMAGMVSGTFLLSFTYGSGGTSGAAYVQTSLDDGNSWMDVVAMSFNQTSKIKAFTVTSAANATGVVPGSKTLSTDSALDGFLGPKWRVIVSTIGTYAGNTRITVDMIAR